MIMLATLRKRASLVTTQALPAVFLSPRLHRLDRCGNDIVFDTFSRKPFANEGAGPVLWCDLDLVKASLSQHLLQFADLRCASHTSGVSRPISSDFLR